ncbi:MAG: hypothetical protein FJ098_15585, partial [Deltaproteobacteria bacterium]|nr:hypothetical protein [Deltaproteobacteria bacterium]
MNRLPAFLALPALLSACGAPGAGPTAPAPGDPCAEEELDRVRCGTAETGDWVLMACQTAGDRVLWLVVESCPEGCADGACAGRGPGFDTREPPPEDGGAADAPAPGDGPPAWDTLFCEPGSLTCLSESERGICNAEGSAWDVETCGEGQACDGGFCLDRICPAGELQGICLGPNSYGVCSPEGTQWIAGYCDQGLTCFEGACVDYQCPPGSVICKGMTAVQECQEQPDGSYLWVVT